MIIQQLSMMIALATMEGELHREGCMMKTFGDLKPLWSMRHLGTTSLMADKRPQFMEKVKKKASLFSFSYCVISTYLDQVTIPRLVLDLGY